MTNRVILLGVLATGPAAMAGTYSFQIAIDNLSNLPSQVIVQTQGRIVAAADSNLLYKSPTGSLTFLGTSRTFSNISFTGDAARVTYFATDPQGQFPYRLYQQQVPETPETPVAAAQFVPLPEPFAFEGRQPIHQQTDFAGRTVFSGSDSATQVVLGGTPDTVNELANDLQHPDWRVNAFNATGDSDPLVGRKLSLGGDAVFVADVTDKDGTRRSIVRMGASDTAPVELVSEGDTIVNVGTIKPVALLGAAGNVRMFAAETGGGTGKTVVIQNAKTNKTVSLSNSSTYEPNGVMTDSGNAVILTDTSGGTLSYFDGSNVTTIATHGENLPDTDLYISELLDIAAPMVNDYGWVAFYAMVERDNDAQKSLLLWHEKHQPIPTVVVRENDPLRLDGALESVIIRSIGDRNEFIGADWSVFKDGLSDDNWLGVGIQYDTELVDGFGDPIYSGAVIVTQLVPEPGTLAWVAVSGALAARRRRNRYI